ncbi:hypothetical protein D3C87_1016830 [compost metagenome]
MNPDLTKLYGENYAELAKQEIVELAKNSNIPFDQKFMQLGIDFLKIKAGMIITNNKPVPTLKSLVSESFGEAAMYKYNIAGGVL